MKKFIKTGSKVLAWVVFICSIFFVIMAGIKHSTDEKYNPLMSNMELREQIRNTYERWEEGETVSARDFFYLGEDAIHPFNSASRVESFYASFLLQSVNAGIITEEEYLSVIDSIVRGVTFKK